MKEEFKNGIKKIREIKLSNDEKISILKNILEAPAVSPYADHIPRPSFFSSQNLSRMWASIAIVGALATFLVYNAERALPGNLLYPVKVGVTEPLRSFLALTPENKAEWESTKALRRLDEATDLALKGKLDTKTRAGLETLFSMHVDSFNDSLSQAPTTTLETNLLRTEFEANVSARVKVLESLGQNLEQKDGESGTPSTTPVNLKEDSSSPASTSPATSAATSTDPAKEESKQNRMELRKLENAVHIKLKLKDKKNKD